MSDKMKNATTRKVVLAVKKYLTKNEYPKTVTVKSIGETIIIDNLGHSSAKQVCEWATGLNFFATGLSSCKIYPTK
jgi:phosphoglucomutase